MVARRPAGRRSRAPATAAVLLAGALALCGSLAGCRPPPGNDPVGRATQALTAPCGLPADAPVGDDALGVALAFTAADAPRDLEGTAALVRATAGGVQIRLVEGAAGDPVALAAAGLSRPACRVAAADRIQVQAAGGRLSWRSPAAVARESWLQAAAHAAGDELPEARTAIATAAAHEPVSLPGRLLAVGDSFARQGRWRQAERMYEQGTRQFPHAGEAWAGLALARRRAYGQLQAIQAGTRGLALRPADGAIRAALKENPFVAVIAPLSPPAVPVVGQPGVWRLVPPAAAGGAEAAGATFLRGEAEAYASCRESVRRSPELRARLAGRAIPDGRWSPAEESACSIVWLQVYLRHRGQGRAADAGLDDLVEIARAGLLDERALHDLAALADPRLLWLLDDDRRSRLFAFVEQHRVVPRQDAGFISPF